MIPTSSVKNKNIVLAISGGIAAYKCTELTRLLVKAGANVRVVMTQAAQSFISPLTMQALSGHLVSTCLFDESSEQSMGHIELGKWADLILIAPATANIMGKIAAGLADDLLTTLCLATTAPVAIAPAMNKEMYAKEATQENIQTLKRRHIQIWGPGQGIQACGDVGPGRMLEPCELMQKIQQTFIHRNQLSDIKIMVTAGPTRENIDPVRYLSNYSSGKMGFAIAQAAQEMGAQVQLIAGPCDLPTPDNVSRVNVVSAQDMYDAVHQSVAHYNIFISCAAVADFRAKAPAHNKLKKTQTQDIMTIELVKNPDIVASVAALTKHRPYTVGFAAETQNVENYAQNKLKRKKLDLICANDVSILGQGFNSENNALHLYWPTGDLTLPVTNKQHLAQLLMNEIFTLYQKKTL